jgi:hypothetical protein
MGFIYDFIGFNEGVLGFGKILFCQQKLPQTTVFQPLDVSALPSGLYLLRVWTENNQQHTRKLVVAH